MKQVIFCVILLFGFVNQTFSQDFSNFDDLPFETQQAFTERSISVINTIFYKIQTEEGWKIDKFNGGSVKIDNISFSQKVGQELSFNITGSWKYTRKSWLDSGEGSGTFTAKARLTPGMTVYMTEVCWKTYLEAGRCHNTKNWAYEKLF